MRRGQFEVMGLAIVVVIVAVGIFFMLSLSLRDHEDPTNQFLEQQFAQNTIDALMKTSLDGCRGTVADYVAWYVTGDLDETTAEGKARCTSKEGMDDIAGNLTVALNRYQGLPFRYEIRDKACETPLGGGCEVVYAADGGCDPRTMTAIRPGRQLVSTYPHPDDAEVVLWVCQPR